MPARFRRPSHGTVVAYLALFVALGGVSYAALKIPKNSVGTKQIRDNAVISAKVKDHSLRSKDFKAGQLPRGSTGQTGPEGPTGPTGPTGADATRLWAVINADGTTARSSGVVSSAKVETPTYAGKYEVIFNRNVTQCDYQVTLGSAGFGLTHGEVAATKRSGNESGVFIQTYDSAGARADQDFHLAVFC